MISSSHKTLAHILTFSGTLPLIGTCLASALQVRGFDLQFIAGSYGALIVSFLCGIHWAVFLFFSEKCPRNLFITSNLITLSVWVSLLTIKQNMALLMQLLAFVYLLVLDLKLRDCDLLPQWYYLMRRNATIIVVVCLTLQLQFV